MRDLEVYLIKDGQKLQGHTVDLGEWDISQGYSKTLHLRNPNPHAKAILQSLKNEDPRVDIRGSKEIPPLGKGVIQITIQAHEYQGEAEEQVFFTDLIDALTGKIKWVRP